MRALLALLFLGVASLPAADLARTGAAVYGAPEVPPIAGAVVAVHGKQIAASPTASVPILRDARFHLVIHAGGQSYKP
jgi:hypothetical protein